ncbi:pyridoxamine 5'-phosphate oxidase [Ottowia sp. GY511]|uniref:Pyridoxamine 5'-phosphate oxidase family protein n=1 Tax=Ottowia flava TaxID=2675430 RepID=A0ABW4KZ54_9BURK|nr:pyridoxamine 5'-phosphate oxidase family protein [Ottowia sp. GY511]TXK23419.1 pyridoxamine 5'-phosphate oxidase [Ottowia sp. GY511]
MKKMKGFKSVAKAMSQIDFCMMHTFSGKLTHVRPMSNNGQVEYEGDNWFFSRTSSTKISDIESDPRVILDFVDMKSQAYITVWGTGSILTDDDQKKAMWHRELEQWFPNGPEDPEVSLIKVSAQRIQTWGSLGDLLLESGAVTT